MLIKPLTNSAVCNQGSSFATGLEVQEKRKRVLLISTGSKAVDTALGGGSSSLLVNCVTQAVCSGGIMSQSITEG